MKGKAMDDIAEQLAIRDRFLRRRQAAMTPAERLRRMQELQARSWAILQSSPEGYANFIRRNFKKRATKVENDRA
jgi:hypothetical protein